MAKRPQTTHVLEIETGIGEPAFIPLTLGQEVQPISIGKKGMWRLDGARILDVHAFVYFDGSSLFLQSADETACAVVDGLNVGKAWTELRAPCKIDVGAARLRFRSLLPDADGQATQAAPRPPAQSPPQASAPPRGESVVNQPPAAGAPLAPMSFPKPERPFRPGEFSAVSDESTRQVPLESASAQRSSVSIANARPHEDEPTTRPEAARLGGPQPARASAPMAATPPFATGSAPAVANAMAPHAGQAPLGALPTGAQASAMLPATGMPELGPAGMASGVAYAMGQAQGSYPYAPPAPYGTGPYGAMPPGAGMPPQGSLPPGGYGSMTQAQGAPELRGLDKFLAEYKAMSIPKRLFIVLLPIAMGVTVWTLWDEEEPAPRPRKVARADAGAPVGSGALASGAVGSGGTPTAVGDAPAGTATASPPAGVTPWPPGVPCPPVGWPPNVPPPCVPNGVQLPAAATVGTAASAASDASAKQGSKPPPSPRPTDQKTLERQAVDAVASGEYPRAASLYEELSRKEPNNRVYVEAARILRMRLDGGAP